MRWNSFLHILFVLFIHNIRNSVILIFKNQPVLFFFLLSITSMCIAVPAQYHVYFKIASFCLAYF